jgi:hypothetical protein
MNVPEMVRRHMHYLETGLFQSRSAVLNFECIVYRMPLHMFGINDNVCVCVCVCVRARACVCVLSDLSK